MGKVLKNIKNAAQYTVVGVFDASSGKAVAAHDLQAINSGQLFRIPAGAAIVDWSVVSVASVTSTGSATLLFKIGSDNLGDAIDKDSFAADAVVPASSFAHSAFPKRITADSTVSCTVETEVLSDGKLYIYITYLIPE